MRVNKEKLLLVMARRSENAGDILKITNMPRTTFNKVLSGKSVSPKTIGIICNALQIDVTEIIED